MTPRFNIAGPCIEGEHYMLPPVRRLGRVMRLVEEGSYFTLHAGRQTGKTTSAQWLVKHYNAGERYDALWVDIQTAREEPDPGKAFREVLVNLDWAMRRDRPHLERPNEEAVEALLRSPGSAIRRYLHRICAAASRPLVVFFDEADGLVGGAMVSFLTQLRSGYVSRAETPFPRALALVGMRQVRDYVIDTEERAAVSWLGTTSPFNITAEASTLSAFTEADVVELLAQHTDATGQRFEPEAAARIFELSQGHPWLVNALGDQVVNRDVEDRAVAVTKEHIEAAKETIIVERRSHIDSLHARLREPRVRRILEPMILGGQAPVDLLDDDVAYVLGLGLVTRNRGIFEIANPIYREVIPRALTYVQQYSIHQEPAWYVTESGGLDMPKLMKAWQKFWRIDGHLAAEGFHYREAGPHLMLMAFLQRVVNGGGRVEREYGLGRGALDLLLLWGEERHAVEVKLRRVTETEADALEQIAGYLDTLGEAEGWLVMFDMRKVSEKTEKLSWQERLFIRDETFEGKLIHVVGC